MLFERWILSHLRLVRLHLCLEWWSRPFCMYNISIIFENENSHYHLQTESIGYSLSISGLISLLLQLMIMPYLVRTYNKAKMYHFCFWMFPLAFPILGVLNVIARGGYDEVTGELSSHASAAIWVGITITQAMSRFAGLAFG